MISRRLSSAILFALCWTCYAYGQAAPVPAAPGEDAAQQREQQEKAQRAAVRRSAISVDSALPILLSGVAIEAGQADGTATINYNQKRGDQSVVAKLSTPVTKDAKDTDFASLNGLAADLTFSLSYTGISAPLAASTVEARKQVGAAQEQVCKEYHADPDECEPEGLIRAAAVKCGFTEVQNVKEVGPSEVADTLAGLLVTAKDAQRTCFESLRDRALDAFDFASFQGHSIRSWAVTGEVGRKPATFFDAGGNKLQKTNVPYAISGAYGWIGKNGVFSLNGRYESRFKDGKDVTRCQPFASGAPGSNLETCEQLPFASPARSSAFVASAEGRWFFTMLAISPVVSYDFKQKVLGLQLPLYFIRDSNKDFTGGVRFGWRDDTHKFTTSVFVSKALSLGD
jgi:hypothetical protein